jgi:hypothetical protein
MDPVMIARYGNVLHKDLIFRAFHLQFVFFEFEFKLKMILLLEMELVKLENFFYFKWSFGMVGWFE